MLYAFDSYLVIAFKNHLWKMLSFMFLNLKTPIANALSSLLPMPSQKLAIYMLVRQFLLEKQFLKNSSVYSSGFYSSILLCKITFIF